MDVIYGNRLSVEDYCRLRKAVGFYDIPETEVRRALEKSDFIVTALIDGVTVAMARLITDGTQVLIMDVIVHPDYQKKGIGKGMIERIRTYIENMDNRSILVNLITNISNVGFYEKLGYSRAEGMRLLLKPKEQAV